MSAGTRIREESPYRTRYEPFPWQADFHASPAKSKWCMCARRVGKTRGAIMEALRDIEEAAVTPVMMKGEKRRAVEAGLIPPIKVWTVAPTRAQMWQIWEEMMEFIPNHWSRRPDEKRERGNRGQRGWQADEYRVFLDLKAMDGKYYNDPLWRHQVTWELKTADNPQGLQTVGLDVLHISEAQDVKEAAWEKVRPTLNSPYRFGRLIVEGIAPESRSHWFAKGHAFALQSADPNVAAFKATIGDNPILEPEHRAEIERDRAWHTEDWYSRYYLAQIPEGAGTFFRKVDEAACGTELAGPREGRKYVGGLDLGRSNDPTVLVIKDRVTRESVFGLELLKTDWNVQKAAVGAEARKWKLEQIVMDATGLGGLMGFDTLYMELLQENIACVAYNFSPQRKYQLFLDYAVSLENGTVSFPPSWTKLSEQLLDMGHRETEGRGHYFFTHSGGHDDWVDAEALALHACDPAPYQMGGEEYSVPLPVGGAAPLRDDGAVYHDRSPLIAQIKRRRTEARMKAGWDKLPEPDFEKDYSEVK